MITDEMVEAAAAVIDAHKFKQWTVDSAKDIARAALEAAEAAAWQSIESAPKDGTPVLICDVKTGSMRWAVYSGGHWRDGTKEARGHLVGCWPTDWRPLPAPPRDRSGG